MYNITQLKTEKSPKETINMHFNHFLPIKGGWGYSKEDAVIIDKNDPSIISSEIFNGVKYEYEFVEKRIYEELIISRSPSEQYTEITWKLIKQTLITDKNNSYDYLLFKVNALLLNDWNKKITYESEFWFDISSFFGNYDGIIIENKDTGKDEIVDIKLKKEFLSSNIENGKVNTSNLINQQKKQDSTTNQSIFMKKWSFFNEIKVSIFTIIAFFITILNPISWIAYIVFYQMGKISIGDKSIVKQSSQWVAFSVAIVTYICIVFYIIYRKNI